MKSLFHNQNLWLKRLFIFCSIICTISSAKADDASWSTDYLSITEANIQTFLNQHSGSLKNTSLCNTLDCDPYNYSDTIANKTGWNRSELNNISGFSPAKLIWLAAQENKLNPVLLLAKLQAEKSLIEQSANQHTLDAAAGYKCNISTTTANCESGFLAQITGFTWQFNSYYNHEGLRTLRDALIEYTPSLAIGNNYDLFRRYLYDLYAEEMNAIIGHNGTEVDSSINSGFSAKIDRFFADYLGKCTDMPGTGWGCQCVDLMYVYVQEALGVPFDNQSTIRGNAYPIFRDKIPDTGIKLIDSFGNTRTLTKIYNNSTNFPQKGDIIFFNSGTYGHVAIVKSATVNSFISLDQNLKNNPDKGSSAEYATHGYGSVVGWLHPMDFVYASTVPPTVKLASPTDVQVFDSFTTNIPLSWVASTDATNYRVIVSTKQDFSGFTDNGGSSTCDSTCGTWGTTDSGTTFTTAKPGQTYYWKVRANNSNLSVVSSWTTARSFSIRAVSVGVSDGTKAEGIMNCLEIPFSKYFSPHQITMQLVYGNDIIYYRRYSDNLQVIYNNKWLILVPAIGITTLTEMTNIDWLKTNYCPSAW